MTRNGATIVIVDDALCEIASFITDLKLRGYDVIYFDDADDAFDFASSSKHADLFILDIMMTSRMVYSKLETDDDFLTGVALANDIRKTRNAPIIFFTNVVRNEATERLVQTIGNSIYIQKVGVNAWRLSDIVSDLLASQPDS